VIEIGTESLTETLDYPSLVEALRNAFTGAIEQPERHRHEIRLPDGERATLLLMPAWRPGSYIGVKTATIFPSNRPKGIPAVEAVFLLLDGGTGRPLAVMDGRTLTARRTAAASALASSCLSRLDSACLLMVGAGALSEPLICAHAAVRHIKRVILWNRTRAASEALARRLDLTGVDVRVAENLDDAVSEADIVSCATLSTTPLVKREHVRPGTHVDLVGAFNDRMRESDDGLIADAEIFVDTRQGALSEAGDLIAASRSGAWRFESIQADLRELVVGGHPGRTTDSAITVFKSVGAAIEDLAAGILAYERIVSGPITKPGGYFR
jgi:ornithine cyclodeaminase